MTDAAVRPTPTRLIIPAPTGTRDERGIRWYEVELSADDERFQPAPAGNRNVLASAETTLLAERPVKTAISDERAKVTIEVSVSGSPADLTLETLINGQRMVISGDSGNPSAHSVTGRPDLSADELAVLGEWGRLASSYNALAQATRQSWGCGSCVLLGAGVTVGAGCCAAGNPGCCVGGLLGASTFVENCQGSCHDLAVAVSTAAAESPVVVP